MFYDKGNQPLYLHSSEQLNFSDYPLKSVRNFAAGGGYSLLWPEATTFLSHRGAYLWPEVAIVACGPRPQ